MKSDHVQCSNAYIRFWLTLVGSELESRPWGILNFRYYFTIYHETSPWIYYVEFQIRFSKDCGLRSFPNWVVPMIMDDGGSTSTYEHGLFVSEPHIPIIIHLSPGTPWISDRPLEWVCQLSTTYGDLDVLMSPPLSLSGSGYPNDVFPGWKGLRMHSRSNLCPSAPYHDHEDQCCEEYQTS